MKLSTIQRASANAFQKKSCIFEGRECVHKNLVGGDVIRCN